MAEMHETHDKNLADLETKGDIFAAETPMSSTTDLFEDGSVDPVYQAKARVLNSAMQEIGMGKYQVRYRAARSVLSFLLIPVNGVEVGVVLRCGVWVVCVSSIFPVF